ncbi:DNA polymerase III subunit alpha [Caproiciproducens sp. CPB-2]|uniref:DNA polymerase III subunit alpha n=1 Tax=Caproiciproducens sp. CPB-2 TaxID=3030017 RepID=UPI0023DCDAC6|nr:DNA polymerase III subunit alpha [Caproiciproducens sp. CPB-2]MDF1495715.1 DNA polymerase III subunit alpha [Caproiciproducens sp. CPB-2]
MFVHLHLHTEYSLLDGACRITELLNTAAGRGDTAVAITDHGVMYGAVDFYKEAKKRGIKPIIGCEVYVAQRTRFDKVHELDSEHRHLVLLCENNTGYQNLIAMVSKSWTEGFYSKPRVDFDLLREHHEGLIALSACLAGEIPRALTAGDYNGAKEAALRYRDIFGEDNFYLELQDHGLREQKRINPSIIKLSEETGIPLIVTNDCHYISQEDNKMHHILLCIQTNHTIEDKDGMEFGSDQFYYKSEEEMRALFPDHPEAADNTVRIAERCNVEFEFGKTKLPHFDTPNGQENTAFFRDKCYEGLYRHYGEDPASELVERLEYELNTIEHMGYVNYYLIVYDFVRYAKEAGIPVGPGRGSGAGSLAAYCIGITGIDPIRYNLLFERFLNPERVSMPDFDIDFSDERRQEMIEYVVRKYGADHVAQIVTFGTMAARGSIRDVGRAMAVPYATVDGVAKLVPMEPNITLEKALKASVDLRQRYDTDPQIHELIDMARKLEGMPRNASTHAAGVVITDRPVAEYVPLAKNNDSVVTQYTMTTLEELGLLKMDFLGLRNLSVIRDAQDMIAAQRPGFQIEDIPLDDKKVYAMLSSGATDGVFQFESAGMRSVIMQLRPEYIEDLIAVISLYRPGPMESIPRYVENRHHPEKVSYRHPLLKDILDVTYGCIVYQEQVMQIFRTLAGYSLGRADIVRRAMSKKKAAVMEREREIFLYGLTNEKGEIEVDGCIRRGVDEPTAKAIYGEMESFASYAFNKSHAAAYALLSYQTAWLKCFYPREYMAALMTSVLDNNNKLAAYIAECMRLGIRVLPPNVNQSGVGFTVAGKDIRFGLLAVRNLGRGFIVSTLRDRKENGQYTTFYGFCKRMYGELNRRALESLIKCGALDGLGVNRRQMLTSVGNIMDHLDDDKRRNVDGQMGFFDTPAQTADDEEYSIAEMPDFSAGDKLSMEKEVTGMYLSGHPMAEYINQYDAVHASRTGDILDDARENGGRFHDGDTVTLLGIIAGVKMKVTKSNTTMAFVTLEDMFGSMEVLVFPKILAQYAEWITEGKIVKMFGRISMREDEEAKLVCESVGPAPSLHGGSEKSAGAAKPAHPGLYIKVPEEQSELYDRAKKYLAIFDGRTPLYIYFVNTKKLVRAPFSMYVSVNDILVRELKNLLGEKNVAVVKEIQQ